MNASATFIGDYFGNITGAAASDVTDYTTSVTTYNDGTNRPTGSSR